MTEPNSKIENPKSKIQNPPPSWYRKGLKFALVVYWLIMFTATHVPKIPKPLQPNFSDKWQHYVAYGLLGLLFSAWRSTRSPSGWRSALVAWGIIIGYGAFDE